MKLPAKVLPLTYSLRWPWWYLQGFKLNPNLAQWPRSKYEGEFDLEIGFLGDLMGLGDKDLAIDPSIPMFFRGCQSVVFNLEGLTEKGKRPVLWNQTTRHFRALDQMREAFFETQLIAGLANNHIDDVTSEELQENLNYLQQLSIQAFGTIQNPTLQLAPGLKLHAFTMWKGKNHTQAATAEDRELGDGEHLLYLHHGHEFHENPKDESKQLIQQLPNSIIGVIGHHTHFPQGLEFNARFIAWSLGNLAVKYGGRPVNWGLALRLGLKKVNEKWTVTGFKYHFIQNQPHPEYVSVSLAKLTPPG